jgi:hypothetical protein
MSWGPLLCPPWERIKTKVLGWFWVIGCSREGRLRCCMCVYLTHSWHCEWQGVAVVVVYTCTDYFVHRLRRGGLN